MDYHIKNCEESELVNMNIFYVRHFVMILKLIY